MVATQINQILSGRFSHLSQIVAVIHKRSNRDGESSSSSSLPSFFFFFFFFFLLFLLLLLLYLVWTPPMFTCVLERYQSVHQSTVFCSTEAGALPDQLPHGGAAPSPHPSTPPPHPSRHHTILVCQSVLIDQFFLIFFFF